MCILFLHVNPRASAGQFRLILAANRDEVYRRPALPAHHWHEDATTIGGRDLEPGKAGGSWLALSTRGRLGALLNIMTPGEHAPELLGRGSLVTNYTMGTMSARDYVKGIMADSSKYRPYNLLAVHISTKTISVCQYCNVGSVPQPVNVTSEFLGISNSQLQEPFLKVRAGMATFKEIVRGHNSTDSRGQLRNQLLGLLRCTERHHPDPVMHAMAPQTPEDELMALSSVFVDIPSKNYGTRAHSVIFVDADGHVDFTEWSLEHDSDQQWKERNISCHLLG